MDIKTSECERMRKLFNKKLSQLYTKRRQGSYEWRSKAWVEEAIRFLENFDPTKFWSSKQFTIAQKFQVEERDGKKILTIKKMSTHVKGMQLVGMEDYFDILYEAHVETGHSARLKMIKYLKNKRIYIPANTPQWLCKYCKICQAHRLAPTARTIHPPSVAKDFHGFVELINMSKKPDGNFKYVMHYRDIASNFLFLRPLMTPNVDEVAEQLLKLFLEIGFPAVLHSPINEDFTKAVIKNLSIAMPACLILLGKQMKGMKKGDGIEHNLHTWVKDNKSAKWSQGVLFVANQMNLRKAKFAYLNGYTAYKGFIGQNPKKGFRMHGLKPVLKTFKFEEDLEKIIYLGSDDNACEELLDQTDDEINEESDEDVKSDFLPPKPTQENEQNFSTDESLSESQRYFKKYPKPRKNVVAQKLSEHKIEHKDKVSSEDLNLALRSSDSTKKTVRMYTKIPKIKPVITYTKEMKKMLAKLSNRSQARSYLKDEKHKIDIIQTRSKAKHKTVNSRSKSLTKNKKAPPEPRSLCIDSNLRELSDWKCGRKQKNIDTCTSDEIDLPSNSNADETYLYQDPTNMDSININMRDFGELQYFETDTAGEVLVSTDCAPLDNVSDYLFREESPTFGTIVKIESLHDNIEETQVENVTVKKQKSVKKNKLFTSNNVINSDVPKKQDEVTKNKYDTSCQRITMLLPQEANVDNSEESQQPILKRILKTYTKKNKSESEEPPIFEQPLLQIRTISLGSDKIKVVNKEGHSHIQQVKFYEKSDPKLSEELQKLKPDELNTKTDSKSKKPNTNKINTKPKEKKNIIKVKIISKRNEAKTAPTPKIAKTKRKKVFSNTSGLCSTMKEHNSRKESEPDNLSMNTEIDLSPDEESSINIDPIDLGIENFSSDQNFGDIIYLKTDVADMSLTTVDDAIVDDIESKEEDNKKKTKTDPLDIEDCRVDMVGTEVPAFATVVKIEPVAEEDIGPFENA